MIRTRFYIATSALLASMALLVSLAAAEISQKHGVRVSVQGKLTPTRLPRHRSAPVSVSVSGKISSTGQTEPPQLRKLTIAINRNGKLSLGGIPLCRIGHIDPSTTRDALAACRSSLIGEGHFSANVKLPEQSPFPSEGKVLAFNGRYRGSPAILAQIYGTEPVPTSYVLPFLIKPAHGTYGTVLEASLPHVTGEWGYVTGVSLNLQRRFLTATCPAPKGFPGAAFPLLRTSFGFDGGLELTSTLIRSCRVR